MQFSSHCPYCLENVSSAMNGKAWREAAEIHVNTCSAQMRKQIGDLRENLSLANKDIEHLARREKELGEMLTKINSKLHLATASEMRLLQALGKLRDGPGNKMTSWKGTWAHQFADEHIQRHPPTELANTIADIIKEIRWLLADTALTSEYTQDELRPLINAYDTALEGNS